MTRFSEDRVAIEAAMAAAAVTLLYSAVFVIITLVDSDFWQAVSAVLLMLGGLLTSIVYTALYQRLRDVHPSLALWALIIGIFSAMGGVVHGGYDLANTIHQPSPDILDESNYPSAFDPRGLLTFGLAGITVGAWAWLLAQAKGYSTRLVRLSWLLAGLLFVIYLARLIALEADTVAVVLPAVFTGFIVSPLWFFWLARTWQIKS